MKRTIAQSALVGILAAAGASSVNTGLAANVDPNLPKIETTATFKTGIFPGTREYTNYVEMAVTFPVAGTYHLETTSDLTNTNGWTQFGKTNSISVADNSTKYMREYTSSDLTGASNAYFRVAGTTNAPSAPQNLLSVSKKTPTYTTLNTTKRLVK